MVKLKESYERFGALVPVLVDLNREIIDGRHRRAIDPSWPANVVFTTDPLEKLAIRWHVNAIRRTVTGEELRKDVNRAAEILIERGYEKGRLMDKLREIFPYTEQYIWRMLDEAYKLRKGPRKEEEEHPELEAVKPLKVEEARLVWEGPSKPLEKPRRPKTASLVEDVLKCPFCRKEFRAKISWMGRKYLGTELLI
jgi:hypothetical protein